MSTVAIEMYCVHPCNGPLTTVTTTHVYMLWNLPLGVKNYWFIEASELRHLFSHRQQLVRESKGALFILWAPPNVPLPRGC